MVPNQFLIRAHCVTQCLNFYELGFPASRFALGVLR